MAAVIFVMTGPKPTMLGPHIRAGSPDTRSSIARTFFASSRRCGSGTASKKSSTLTSVGLVLVSAMSAPFKIPYRRW